GVGGCHLAWLPPFRAAHNTEAVSAGLAASRESATRAEVNVMPSILGAVRAHATVGEIVDALAAEFGRWTEDPVI
ncbi:MAG: methylmalonyl-CoA mutase family protein, partial [Acidimicrobiales bacterium]